MEKTLQVFREYRNSLNLEVEVYDDYCLTRFLRARKYDWEASKLMFDNYLEWRKKEEVDTILDVATS